jgi:hypothetical protein
VAPTAAVAPPAAVAKPVPSETQSPRAQSGVTAISPAELEVLLRAAKPVEQAVPALPREQIAQDDIDRLFGGA